jgi:hypothetical protein
MEGIYTLMKKAMVITIAIILIIIAILALMLHPAYSPLSGIHDKDSDGFADAVDEYPDDFDNDGYDDDVDMFPENKKEWLDTDNDGFGDNSDKFIEDPNEWNDTDDDGFGDNSDVFPDDPDEWNDTDEDGIGDNADFYDAGNGKIKISIVHYMGDVQADGGKNHADSYYVISVDVNRDGIFDHNISTPIHTNEAMYSVDPDDVLIVDILDNTTALNFRILVYDANEAVKTENDLLIDYTDDSSSKYFVHTVYSPFNNYWEQDGLADSEPALLIFEVDCILQYKIEVIG